MNQIKSTTVPASRVLMGYWRHIDEPVGTPEVADIEASPNVGTRQTREMRQRIKELHRTIAALRAQWERLSRTWTEHLLEMEVRGNLVSPLFKVILGLYCADEQSLHAIAAAFEGNLVPQHSFDFHQTYFCRVYRRRDILHPAAVYVPPVQSFAQHEGPP